jgi:hypothetical protein
MKRLAALSFAALVLAACASETSGPAGPSAPIEYQPSAAVFNARDFAWSTAPGGGAIEGTLTYHAGGLRYSCRGRDVILTPETPWSRQRMVILYGSPVGAAVPLEIVRARTPSASSGDYASFVRKTTCGSDNRFSFAGLPDGGWFVITLARPADGPGDAVAVMRRVETRGAPLSVTLN